MGVTVEIKCRKGSYCARIMGPDPKWNMERAFENGTYVKRDKGRLVFSLAPGYYETQTWEHGQGKVRRYWRVDSLTYREIPTTVISFLPEIALGPEPGSAGAYDDHRCHCGNDMTSIDAHGLPVCDEHVETAERVSDDMPATA